METVIDTSDDSRRMPVPDRIVTGLTIALAVYWLAMFTGTHIPRIPVPMEGGGTDKWLHFGAYAGLGFLLSAVMFARRARSGDELGGRGVFFRIATVVAIGLLYGAADEWLQGFVGRDPDLWDWYADAAGITCGATLFAWGASRWFRDFPAGAVR